MTQITVDRALLEQALEALTECTGSRLVRVGDDWVSERSVAITAMRTALAQPQQEPFAWHVCSVNSDGSLSLEHAAAWEEAAHEHINNAITEDGIEEAAQWVVRPAYHAPPRREWVVLTDEDIRACVNQLPYSFAPADFVRAIEAKLKERNHD